MATPPTFSAGAVLTAAQMNAVGLWRVTDCTVSSSGGTAASASNGVITIGNGNTSVTISNAFSAEYDNYLIKISGGGATDNTNMSFQLGSTTTNYNGTLIYSVNSAAGTFQGAGDNAASKFSFLYRQTQTSLVGHIDIISPYLAEHTFVKGMWASSNSFGNYVGFQNSTTQFTSFTLSPDSGSFTGGTVRVYGYRN